MNDFLLYKHDTIKMARVDNIIDKLNKHIEASSNQSQCNALPDEIVKLVLAYYDDYGIGYLKEE